MEQEKEKEPKLKIWLKLKEDKRWHITKVQGLFPKENSFSEEDLRVFLNENKDVEHILTY